MWRELRRGLREGIMDVIATDHAPHGAKEKQQSHGEGPLWDRGAGNIRSPYLYGTGEAGDLKYPGYGGQDERRAGQDPGAFRQRLCGGEERRRTWWSLIPGNVIRSTGRPLSPKGKNTPFHGREVWGEVRYTLVDGQVVYEKK